MFISIERSYLKMERKNETKNSFFSSSLFSGTPRRWAVIGRVQKCPGKGGDGVPELHRDRLRKGESGNGDFKKEKVVSNAELFGD